jgi:hypothetical protein
MSIEGAMAELPTSGVAEAVAGLNAGNNNDVKSKRQQGAMRDVCVLMELYLRYYSTFGFLAIRFSKIPIRTC